jgi:phosphoglycolate phosphatase
MNKFKGGCFLNTINTILFDLDGTLLDTLEDLADSMNYALKFLRYPELSIDQVRRFVGNGVGRLVELSLPDGKSNPDYETCLNLFRDHYNKNMKNKTKPYEGITELLEKMYGQYRMAIVSNKFDKAVKDLAKTYFHPFITVAIGESEAIKKKPAPDMVQKALEELGAKKEEAVYVGDSEVDVKTSSNAGLRFIGVSWGFREPQILRDLGAVTVIDKPEELLRLIEKFENI